MVGAELLVPPPVSLLLFCWPPWLRRSRSPSPPRRCCVSNLWSLCCLLWTRGWSPGVCSWTPDSRPPVRRLGWRSSRAFCAAERELELEDEDTEELEEDEEEDDSTEDEVEEREEELLDLDSDPEPVVEVELVSWLRWSRASRYLML